MRKINSFLLFLLISLTFNSCAVTKYFEKGYENFITYFNIYYNANRIFKETETELLKQQKDLFLSKPITSSGSYTNKFIQVIEKCSKILQYHQNSSFVDDALFIIGKSYFYQGEFPSAIRKFTELITNFPESPHYLKSKLWIAKSYAQTVEIDRALKLLNEVYSEAKDFGGKYVISNALLEILKIYSMRNDYDGILNVGNEYVKISDDDEAIAQVYLLMGKAYAKLNQLDRAVDNFSKVKKYTSDYYYRFKSQLELAKILREQQKFDKAKEILDALYSESLFDGYKDYTELEYAYLFLTQKDTLNALSYFIKIDTSYSSRETGAIAQFEIANYLENTLGKLDSAKIYYDKSLRAQLPEEIKKIVQIKSQLLQRYKNIWMSISNLAKQIPILRTFPVDSTYPKFQEIEIDSALLNDSVYLAELEEYYKEKRKADSLYAIKLQQDSLRYQANLKTADSLEVNIAKLKFDLAIFFMIDYDKLDSAKKYLEEIVKNFPNKDFSERAFYALANYYESIGEKEKADSIYDLIYENFTNSDISKIVAKRLGLKPKITQKDLPDIDYYAAEDLVKNNKYEEAISKFYSIYEKYNKTDYAPKSLLMIGNIYENKIKMYDSAYSVYKFLKERYPSSLYAQKINLKLIAYESELQRREMEKKSKEASTKQDNQNPDDEKLKPENTDETKEKIEELNKIENEKSIKPDSSTKKEDYNLKNRK